MYVREFSYDMNNCIQQNILSIILLTNPRMLHVLSQKRCDLQRGVHISARQPKIGYNNKISVIEGRNACDISVHSAGHGLMNGEISHPTSRVVVVQ